MGVAIKVSSSTSCDIFCPVFSDQLTDGNIFPYLAAIKIKNLMEVKARLGWRVSGILCKRIFSIIG